MLLPKIMKSPEELNQQLRQRILGLSGVTERPNAGIHEDAFFVGGKMFMHIHSHGHCDIRLAKPDQERVLAESKARPHRWAPEQGYVTFMARNEKDLAPAMELIRMSHEHFASNKKSHLRGFPHSDVPSRRIGRGFVAVIPDEVRLLISCCSSVN